jgi:hypothetical protein
VSPVSRGFVQTYDSNFIPFYAEGGIRALSPASATTDFSQLRG